MSAITFYHKEEVIATAAMSIIPRVGDCIRIPKGNIWKVISIEFYMEYLTGLEFPINIMLTPNISAPLGEYHSNISR